MRLLVAVFLLAMACAAQTIRIRETAGVARRNEPVVVSLDGVERVLFVTIGANETKSIAVAQARAPEPLRVERAEGETGIRVSNRAFTADLTKRVIDGRTEDSGMLRALTFHRAGVTLLLTPNRMHWAPSFQRAGASGYTSIAMWQPVQLHALDRSDAMARFTREGFTEQYPEIRLWAEYRFLAHVPYFLFEARMDVVRPIEMYWLRNQEMTMDSFFTHVAWPEPGGAAKIVTFEERKPILERSPLPVDLPWVAFFHREKGYGFGAVVLAMHSTTLNKAHVSITDGADDGKYWDRHLISRVNTKLNPGDRYTERTAYVLFRTSPGAELREFLEWERKLRNPVEIAWPGSAAR